MQDNKKEYDVKELIASYRDNPMLLLSSFFVFGCVLWIALQTAKMFTTSYEDIQRKNQTPQQDETPLAHFISVEALHGMQTWLVMVVLAAGAFIVCFSRIYVAIPLFLLLAFGVWFVPRVYYSWKVKKRQEEFESHMLPFVMLLSNSLRGGLSMPEAIKTTIEAVGGSIEEEFERALKEHRLGVDFQEALKRINQRIDSENLKLFITTVCMTTVAGGDTTAILENIVTTIRMRNDFNDKLKIGTTKLKKDARNIMGVTIVMIPSMLLLVPEMFKPLYTHPIGWGAFFLVGIIMIGSFIWLKKISTIDL